MNCLNTHFKTLPCFSIQQLNIYYQEIHALKDISFKVQIGDQLAIMGPNGGGKSTLLKAIMGIIPLTSGSIDFHPSFKNNISYLPQIAEIDRDFPVTVYDVVAMGLWKKKGLLKAFYKTDQEFVRHALKKVGLSGFDKRLIAELSGGQCQRVLFARTIVQNTDIILLDEPFSGIDERTIEDLMKIIQEWHELKKTVLVVLHDYDLVKKYFSQAVLVAQKIIEKGAPEKIFHHDILLKAHLFLDKI